MQAISIKKNYPDDKSMLIDYYTIINDVHGFELTVSQVSIIVYIIMNNNRLSYELKEKMTAEVGTSIFSINNNVSQLSKAGFLNKRPGARFGELSVNSKILVNYKQGLKVDFELINKI